MVPFLIAGMVISSNAQSGTKAERLLVSDNHRFLVYEDGTPFFWLADTGWELFQRLDNEQADQYLSTRAKQGFTVVQAVVLAELNGLHDPDPYGNLPLKDDDPAKPNEAYFRHVDHIVHKAASLGMFIAMLPTWGDKVNKSSWGAGPVVFDTANAFVYGKYLGNRYRHQWNIIWILGGDRNPRNMQDVAIWRAMAAGITAGVGNKDSVLMSFHPQPHDPGGSSAWFHHDEWLDFNMNQTGHCKDQPIYDKIAYDYNLKPVKPTLDAEPLYEDHPICFDAKKYGFSDADDIRKDFYWDIFAGAFGVTYGCHDVWQMYAPGKLPVNGARRYWYDALHLPGAEQMRYVKKLMLSRPFLKRIPDQSLIIGTQAKDSTHVSATRAADGSYAFIYTPAGQDLDINTGLLNGKKLKVSWYNPRNGHFSRKKKRKKKPEMHFIPSAKNGKQDWVLVLDAVR
jgi:hypothetical protein